MNGSGGVFDREGDELEAAVENARWLVAFEPENPIHQHRLGVYSTTETFRWLSSVTGHSGSTMELHFLSAAEGVRHVLGAR